MTSDRDDALRWDGDDDPTLGAAAPASPALPRGYAAVGKGSDQLNRDAAPDRPSDATVDTPDSSADSTGSAPADEPDADNPDAAEPQADAPGMGNATLVTIGVLGGAYALYTIGWIIGGLRLQGAAQYLVADMMFLASFWLAVLAPAVWFGTTFLLTRHTRAWVRIVWLVAGLLLLAPWPFVMTGAVGQ